MSYLSIILQAQLEERLSFLDATSLNLSGDPYGSDARKRVQTQHWIAYQGSDYPSDNPPPPGGEYSQERELEFQHYVEVQDLRRDFRRALAMHESVMAALAGFRPNVPGVLAPVRLTDDSLVSAKVENEVVYRYRATYRVRCQWFPELDLSTVLPGWIPPEELPSGISPKPIPDELAALLPQTFQPEVIRGGIWRSPIDQVGAPPPVSVKDKDAQIEDDDA